MQNEDKKIWEAPVLISEEMINTEVPKNPSSHESTLGIS
jgi:hypothetical protein